MPYAAVRQHQLSRRSGRQTGSKIANGRMGSRDSEVLCLSLWNMRWRTMLLRLQHNAGDSQTHRRPSCCLSSPARLCKRLLLRLSSARRHLPDGVEAMQTQTATRTFLRLFLFLPCYCALHDGYMFGSARTAGSYGSPLENHTTREIATGRLVPDTRAAARGVGRVSNNLKVKFFSLQAARLAVAHLSSRTADEDLAFERR